MEFAINTRMSPEEKLRLEDDVKQINWENFVKDKENGRIPKQKLGQDDFLQLLMKQLSYQDPLAPMEDKEFIAQMAQFSSLKQMTNMSEGVARLSGDFGRVADLISGNAAISSLGKSVELTDGDKTVQGVIRAVTQGSDPKILVNGNYYDWTNVVKVFEE